MTRRKILLVAFHFPPIQGSTGTTRTVAFSRFLEELGWNVQVLTIRPSAYERTSHENDDLIPVGVSVKRSWGVDTRSSLSAMGRYPLILAIPDRWQSWIAGAYLDGSKIIRSWRPDVIMTTYPIPSAHVIGILLKKKFKLPWVAEFRDPMLQDKYPDTSLQRWAYGKIERAVFRAADEIVVTTDLCRQTYSDRYPDFPSSRITTISNGYDPEIFSRSAPKNNRQEQSRVVLLHSGLLYPHERNPDQFFEAVRQLAADGFLNPADVEFRFRASSNEDTYTKKTKVLGIEKFITFLPNISYVEALEEMQSVDALMIFQADNSSEQIPAKIYEYFYCRKPVLGLTDPTSATGQLLASVGVPYIASLEDVSKIKTAIRDLLVQLEQGREFLVSDNDIHRFSRRNLTSDLDLVLLRAINAQMT